VQWLDLPSYLSIEKTKTSPVKFDGTALGGLARLLNETLRLAIWRRKRSLVKECCTRVLEVPTTIQEKNL